VVLNKKLFGRKIVVNLTRNRSNKKLTGLLPE